MKAELWIFKKVTEIRGKKNPNGKRKEEKFKRPKLPCFFLVWVLWEADSETRIWAQICTQIIGAVAPGNCRRVGRDMGKERQPKYGALSSLPRKEATGSYFRGTWIYDLGWPRARGKRAGHLCGNSWESLVEGCAHTLWFPGTLTCCL